MISEHRVDEDSKESQLSPSNLFGKFGASGEESTTVRGNEAAASVKINDTEDTHQVFTTMKKSGQLSAAVQETEAKVHTMMKQGAVL